MMMLRALAFVILAVLPVGDQFQDDPDPSRFAGEMDTFAEWDARNTVPEHPVVFVGSSSIRFWPSALYFPDLPVVNRGFGGSHISDVNYYIEHVVLKYAPRAIVFYAGDNDIGAGKPPAQVFDDYKAFVKRVHAEYPKTLIFFVPIKPSIARWTLWPTMQEANTMIEKQALNDPRLFYVDMATPMLGPDGTPDPDIFLEDGLHLNRAGYDLWSQILRPRLHGALENTSVNQQ